MKIKDILQRDPATNPLVNQGQARIADTLHETDAREELRGELSTFVCEGQYADGIEKIIRSYLDNQSKTSQRAAWVSGFFGSGKSHVLKMLCHLWMDTGSQTAPRRDRWCRIFQRSWCHDCASWISRDGGPVDCWPRPAAAKRDHGSCPADDSRDHPTSRRASHVLSAGSLLPLAAPAWQIRGCSDRPSRPPVSHLQVR